ncbi:MAG: NADH-quinone oxidoreductase subunit A [Bacteroidia bacterium]|nr:NADH-quinone oxidoreductase subunit A [Bacteroidia bacterium]
MTLLADTTLQAFGEIGAYLLGGLAFAGLISLTSRLIAPDRPNPVKASSYECGEEPEGSGHVRLHMRFFTVGLVFLIFEVEVLFLFPWALVLGDAGLIGAVPGWGRLALAEAGAFLLILTLGLVYVWAKGDLEWVQPRPAGLSRQPAAPDPAYDAVNRKYAAAPESVSS